MNFIKPSSHLRLISNNLLVTDCCLCHTYSYTFLFYYMCTHTLWRSWWYSWPLWIHHGSTNTINSPIEFFTSLPYPDPWSWNPSSCFTSLRSTRYCYGITNTYRQSPFILQSQSCSSTTEEIPNFTWRWRPLMYMGYIILPIASYPWFYYFKIESYSLV